MLKFPFLTGRKIIDLETDLRGVNGFTGSGEIEYASWKNGARRMEIELRGVAGPAVDLYIDGAHATTVALRNGSVDRKFDSTRGDDVPTLSSDAHIEIRQNGHVILEGRLGSD